MAVGRLCQRTGCAPRESGARLEVRPRNTGKSVETPALLPERQGCAHTHRESTLPGMGTRLHMRDMGVQCSVAGLPSDPATGAKFVRAGVPDDLFPVVYILNVCCKNVNPELTFILKSYNLSTTEFGSPPTATRPASAIKSALFRFVPSRGHGTSQQSADPHRATFERRCTRTGLYALHRSLPS